MGDVRAQLGHGLRRIANLRRGNAGEYRARINLKECDFIAVVKGIRILRLDRPFLFKSLFLPVLVRDNSAL